MNRRWPQHATFRSGEIRGLDLGASRLLIAGSGVPGSGEILAPFCAPKSASEGDGNVLE